jgi:hypothetical protein
VAEAHTELSSAGLSGISRLIGDLPPCEEGSVSLLCASVGRHRGGSLVESAEPTSSTGSCTTYGTPSSRSLVHESNLRAVDSICLTVSGL